MAIFHRDGFRCLYCMLQSNLRGDRLTLDHYKPKHKGGSHSPRNLMTACLGCNSAKQDGRPFGVAGWRDRLRRAQRKKLNREVGQILVLIYRRVRPSKRFKRLSSLVPPPF